MPSKGSITKTIRINAEDKEYIEGMMAKEGVTWSGAIHKLVSERVYPQTSENDMRGVPKEKEDNTSIPAVIMRDIESMCSLSEITVGDFMRELCEAMNNGDVMYEDGKFTSTEEIDLSRFREACDAKGVPYQKMIDKATQNVWSS